jgi:signal transduction protein with GAF and PtsI domain
MFHVLKLITKYGKAARLQVFLCGDLAGDPIGGACCWQAWDTAISL